MSMLSEMIREFVNDPSVGKEYGKWGALNREQRKLIRLLCDTCDHFERAADEKIKEQQAEIERLERHELKEAMIFNSETVKKAVTEAVKEFAERLKENTVTVKIGKQTCRVITVDGIDYLLKETG